TGFSLARKMNIDSTATPPLTVLSEDETLFQSSVRRFARERLAPHVRAMDEAGVFRKDLLQRSSSSGSWRSRSRRNSAARAAASFNRFWRLKSCPASTLRQQ